MPWLTPPARRAVVLALGIAAAGVTAAADPFDPVVAPAAATTAPAPVDAATLQKLVAQLGDSSFETREAASTRLAQVGQPAFTALWSAIDSNDPEIQQRATDLILKIAHDGVERGRAHPADDDSNDLTVAVDDNSKTIDVLAGVKKLHIEQDAASLKMTVTFPLEGKEVKQEFVAKNPDELRTKEPLAYRLYETYGGGPGPGFTYGGMQATNGVTHIKRVNAPGDDLYILRYWLTQHAATAHTPADTLKALNDQLDKVAAAQVKLTAPPVSAEAINARAELTKTYNDLCDQLRLALLKANLPDPGAMLPPGALRRMDVALIEGDVGQTVRTVTPGGRGERLGFKPGDTILAINGKPAPTLIALRTLIAAEPPPVTVAIVRDEHLMMLTEK